jgi:hypothetical protein
VVEEAEESEEDGSMNQYQITANHLGLGEVKMIFLAENKQAAFSKFKNIVFNHKQWLISENKLLAGIERNPDVGVPGRHRMDCRCVECEL